MKLRVPVFKDYVIIIIILYFSVVPVVVLQALCGHWRWAHCVRVGGAHANWGKGYLLLYIHTRELQYHTYQLKYTAQTGSPLPNMSTTFMGKSSPDEDLCRQTPRSAEPGGGGQISHGITGKQAILVTYPTTLDSPQRTATGCRWWHSEKFSLRSLSDSTPSEDLSLYIQKRSLLVYITSF